MPSQSPYLSSRQRKWLRRGGIALALYTIAVLVIVPWENVWVMLFVPYYPVLLGLFAIGVIHLVTHSRVGRWLFWMWLLMLPVSGYFGLSRYRSFMSELNVRDRATLPSMEGLRASLWMTMALLLIGCVLALWGWVLFFRHRRTANRGVGDGGPS